MKNNKVYLFLILLITVLFLLTFISCWKVKEQIETEVDIEPKEIDQEVSEKKEEVKEDLPAEEIEEEIPEAESEEKIPNIATFPNQVK